MTKNQDVAVDNGGRGAGTAVASAPSQSDVQVAARTDDELSKLLALALASATVRILVVANGYQAKLFHSPSLRADWIEIGAGDVGPKTADLLLAAAKAKTLFWQDVRGPVGATAADDASAHPAPVTAVSTWQSRRDRLTGTKGRSGELDNKTRLEVASLAAWRCQFNGCGEDLREHLAGGKPGNYSYFAHIVASSPDGPRGDLVDSPRLANDPTNVMLLCDKCHRLVDRVDPDAYGTPRLREMRERNIREVKRLLDALSYPAATMLVIGGNIEGQNAGFNQRAAEEAMWTRKLRMAGSEPHWFMRNAGLAESTHQAYWGALFRSLHGEVAGLQNYLSGASRGGQAPGSLAVFPTHAISIQVLAGRIIGNSTTVQLFQPNRNAPSGAAGERWAWPADAVAPDPDKYELNTRIDHRDEEEAALLVHLTAVIPPAAFPWAADRPQMPTLELRARDPGVSVIGSEKDLDALAVKFDDALKRLQDEWRVRRIHLLLVAPSSACVLLGQKLQARHHAAVVLYERQRVVLGQQPAPFVPTIEIRPKRVELVGTGDGFDLN